MRPLRIAVADDEPAIRTLLATWLTRLGHVVVPAADGDELLGLCRTGGFDLVVSDVRMPGTDGVTAAEIIRRECGLPVILLSGGWTPEQDRRARAAGAFVLSKPLLPLALVAVVEESALRAERHRAPARRAVGSRVASGVG